MSKEFRDEKKYERIRITKRGGEIFIIKNFNESGLISDMDVEGIRKKIISQEDYDEKDITAEKRHAGLYTRIRPSVPRPIETIHGANAVETLPKRAENTGV